MGKKTRKIKSNDAESGMPRHFRREVLDICHQLLEKCSLLPQNAQNEWDSFVEIYNIVEKLRKKQQPYTFKRVNRVENIPKFLDWLVQNKVDISKVSIEQFGHEGYGLKATQDLKEGDLILTIPRNLMMKTSDAKSSALGPIISTDKILQAMPNIIMSLHLLCEYANLDESFWGPYIKVLPSSYTTPLYFTMDEMLLLKNSPIASDVINQYKSIARQYAYFFRLFQGQTDTTNLPIKTFCYDDYRWAVSTVMTRQNKIPSKMNDEASESNDLETVLIPLWDFCNHSNGQISTGFNDELDRSDCFAMRDFKTNQQIMIYYGSRSNSEFLIHNGFVFEDNTNDSLAIKLGVSKNDTLFSLKAEVLARISLNVNHTFYLTSDPVCPIDSSLLAFLRIFSMDMETLMHYLRGDGLEERRARLGDVTEWVDPSNEYKAWNFLETRCLLLLKSYSGNEADVQAESNDKTENTLNILKLKKCEKHILQHGANFSNKQKMAVVDFVEKYKVADGSVDCLKNDSTVNEKDVEKECIDVNSVNFVEKNVAVDSENAGECFHSGGHAEECVEADCKDVEKCTSSWESVNSIAENVDKGFIGSI